MTDEELNGLTALLSSPEIINRQLAIELALGLGISIQELSEICIDHFYNTFNSKEKHPFLYDFILDDCKSVYYDGAFYLEHEFKGDLVLGKTSELKPEYFEKLIKYYLDDKQDN